jgi:hypothetical protein
MKFILADKNDKERYLFNISEIKRIHSDVERITFSLCDRTFFIDNPTDTISSIADFINDNPGDSSRNVFYIRESD